MKLVIIESPYKGDTEKNIEYAKKCMLDSLSKNECPFASHLLYTQILNDNLGDERATGIALGLEVMKRADLIAVYSDYGISQGMDAGIRIAKEFGIKIEYRNIEN